MHPQIPDLMTAIEITEPGGPDRLAPKQRLVPQPAAGEVLIKVATAGVNPPDCLQRQGSYPRHRVLPTSRDWKSPAP